LFIALVSLLILVISLGGARLAVTQNSLPSFHLVGNTVMHADRLGLTVDQGLQTGAAWLLDKQQVQDGFTAEFQWQINRVNQRRGAEGFAFVIHNADGQPFPDILLGEGRHGLGYQGIPNSIAVEFDTVQTPIEDFGSGKGDPNHNHISVQTRGTEPNNANTNYSLGFTTQGEPTIPLFANGSRHTTKIAYTPGTLSIFLDDLTKPVLTVPLDLGATLRLDQEKAWVGLTAATGRRFQAHDIYSFSFVGTQTAQQ
jgi:hypothetical protein